MVQHKMQALDTVVYFLHYCLHQ